MSTNAGPTFEYPPVVETALSIQFDELRQFRTTHFGLFYPQVRERFPVIEDKPRLEPIVELFPLPIRVPSLRVSRADARPERVWFRDALGGCKILQLQPDRFGFNWCRNEEAEYPRYTANRPLLFEEFARFCQFANEHGLGDVRPNLCEVTYVNHIRPQKNESLADCFSATLSGVEWKSSDNWLMKPPEAFALNRVFTIGEQRGRLYIEATAATEHSGSNFILLKITARVIHLDGEILEETIDLAHDWVVRSFVSVTNADVRKLRWRQRT